MAALTAGALAGADGNAREPVPAADAPVVLWNELTTATTQSEMQAFKAHLPNNRAELLPGCTAQVLYRLAQGRLISLIFIGFDRDKACADEILKDYTAHYGSPESQAVVSGSIVAAAGRFTDFSHSDPAFRWRVAGRRIELVKQPGHNPGYNLIFTVRADKYLN